MNRLQKKCIIGTAGFHLLLLVVIVVVGSGFFNRTPKPDNSPILTFIPDKLVDPAVNGGVQNPQPPPPQPVQPVQPKPQPQPVKAVEPPKPVPPSKTMIDRVRDLFKEPVKPAPTKPVTTEHKVEPNLKKTSRTSAKPVPNPNVRKAIKNLQGKLSKPVDIQPVGNNTVAAANYATVVRSVYDGAWVLPNSIAKDEDITVSVTIASDGTVISSKIITPSGDGPADDSVQKALDRVQTIAPFPEGSTDKERTYTIVFNPQVKSEE